MKKDAKNGFTLLELLTVMAMGIILMSISTAAYYGLVRGNTLNAAVSSVRTTLSLARQHAVCNQRKVYIIIDKQKEDLNGVARGRLCMAEYIGTHIGSSQPYRFRTSVTIGATNDYVGARIFNIDSGERARVTASNSQYLEVGSGEIDWQVGDKCAVLQHDWVVLPEGIIFGDNTSDENLVFMQDGSTPIWSALPNGFEIEIIESNGAGIGRLRVHRLGGQIDVLEGVVN